MIVRVYDFDFPYEERFEMIIDNICRVRRKHIWEWQK